MEAVGPTSQIESRILRILIYTHEFPPFRGGAGVYSYDLAVGLKSLGLEIHVATPLPKRAQEALPETAQSEELYMHYMAEWQTRPPGAHLFLVHLQLRHHFDLLLVTERRAQEIVATMVQGSYRYAAVIHGTELVDYFERKHAELAVAPGLMARFYQGAEVCIAVSNATLDLAKKVLNTEHVKLAVVQNGISLGRLPPARPEDSRQLKRTYGDDTEIVFCLGRLDLDKGQDVLIKAFQKVRRVRPRARLLIGGDGPHIASLLQLRKALALDDCVDFVGAIPSAKLPAYFDLCDVFALTSRNEKRWEGFGLVYLEAAYYGRATVGGNEGGAPEAISDKESGLIVDPRDDEAIALAIISLLADEGRRTNMGINGKRRVLTYFNSERMAAETLEYIDRGAQNLAPLRRVAQELKLALWLMIYALRVAASAGAGLISIGTGFARTSR